MKFYEIMKVAAAVAMTVTAASCTDEIKSAPDGAFRFNVSTSETAMTKSDNVSESESYDISFDGVRLTLIATAEPNVSNPFESIATKGEMINSAADISKFSIDIENVATAASVVKSGGVWELERTADHSNYVWPENVSPSGLRFDSYYKDGSNLSISGNDVSYSTTATTAADSKDVLIGRTYAVENDVPVSLYHPLSAIKIKVKDLVEGVKIKSLAITGLYKSGSFELPVSDGTLGAVALDDISWSIDGERSSYTAEDLGDGDMLIFFVIPQSVSASKLSIVFEQPGDKPEQSMEIDFPAVGLDNGSWKSGYYYTYTISGGGFMDVETSGFGETGKVIVTNTGSLPGYVRAAVVCNWFDGIRYTGAWTGTATVSEDWTLKEDGFYYYKEKVDVDSTIDFIAGVTDGARPNGSASSSLKKMVSVQIVEDNSVWAE